jgi:hypothetical protein
MNTLATPACAEEVLARLGRLRDDSSRRWGRMSPHQMVCHLADAHRMALGEKPTRARAAFPVTVLTKAVALYLPLPWPEGIPTAPELRADAGGTPPDEFAADLAELCTLTGRLRTASTLTATHPLFGPMSRRAWLRWGYLHLDHHLRQFGE